MSDKKTPNRYRQLALKWTGITSDMEQENHDRKQVLQDRVRRLEDKLHDEMSLEEDPRFKPLRDENNRLRQQVQQEKQELLHLSEWKQKRLAEVQQAMQNISSQHEERQAMTEKQLYSNIDNKILVITTNMTKVQRESARQLEDKRQAVASHLSIIKEELEKQKRQREENFRGMTQQIESQLGEFQEQMNNEARIREECQAKLFSTIEQVSHQLRSLIDTERKERQLVNECLLQLLEDTCVKIHQRFTN